MATTDERETTWGREFVGGIEGTAQAQWKLGWLLLSGERCVRMCELCRGEAWHDCREVQEGCLSGRGGETWWLLSGRGKWERLHKWLGRCSISSARLSRQGERGLKVAKKYV